MPQNENARDLEIECFKLIYTLINSHEIPYDNQSNPGLAVRYNVSVSGMLDKMIYSSQMLRPKE